MQPNGSFLKIALTLVCCALIVNAKAQTTPGHKTVVPVQNLVTKDTVRQQPTPPPAEVAPMTEEDLGGNEFTATPPVDRCDTPADTTGTNTPHRF